MGYPSYSVGHERTNGRGQVFVFIPEHPASRADGFYPRARFVFEEILVAGTLKVWGGKGDPRGKGPLIASTEYAEWPDLEKAMQPRLIPNTERVYHMDNNANNDDPSNLMLFPTHKALMQFRSHAYHDTKDGNYKDRLAGITEAQKDLRAEVGVERARMMELRRRKAKAAHARRKKEENEKRREAARASLEAAKVRKAQEKLEAGE